MRSNKQLRHFVCLFIFACSSLSFADELTITRNGATTEIQGEIVVEAQDNSILFRARDGQLKIFKPGEIQDKTDDDSIVKPLSKKELGKQLLSELPDGFRVFEAGNFVIAYQTEKSYARWVGGLYNRLSKGFNTYWSKKKKFKLNKPEYPLGVIIFASRPQYARFVQNDLGVDPGTMVAYYNLMTNRVAMYDLTSGQDRMMRPKSTERNIVDVLGQPSAIPMVATVIHEGTHQLMFNMGMQQRFADTPLWINEGLAMFFETPDLKTKKGWRAIGQINGMRLNHFRANLGQRKPNTLENMVSSDELFQDEETKLLAYSEAWALNYFLLKKHSDEYVAYLKHMSKKEPQKFDGPEKRLAEFKQFLGEDLGALDREFIHYIRSLSK